MPAVQRGGLALLPAQSQRDEAYFAKAQVAPVEIEETIERVKRSDVDQYKYGFETEIESVKAPQRSR